MTGPNAARSLALIPIVLSALLMLLVASPSAAFTNVYFFGDSLTDTGNNGPADIAPPASLQIPYGYDPDRWTNLGGSIWSETFASSLGYAAVADSDGGTNYAVGGARADEMAGQVSQFSTDVGGSADSNALYIVWAGGNDLLQGFDTATTVTDVTNAIMSLSALGAQNFLVGNVPNFEPLAPGSGPLGGFAPIPAGADLWATQFNGQLSTALAGLTGLTVYEYDAHAFLDPILADPVGSGYSQGLNLCVNDANCIAGIGTGDFVMHDHLHAMSGIHDQIAAGALAIIPEPSTALLLGLGLGALGMRRS